MRIALALLAMTAVAAAAPDWPAAEKVVRDHLAAEKLTVVDLYRQTRLSLGTAFTVRTKAADGTVSGRFLVVRGARVFDKPGDATVSALLAADDFLRTRAINERDLLVLLKELSKLPAGLGMPFTNSPDASLNPKLTFGKDSATFVLYSARDVRVPGASVQPKEYFTRATLTIAHDYALAWKVVDEERPAK